MSQIILKIVTILSLLISLQAKESALWQSHLTSVSPEASSSEISVDTNIEIKFDLPIVESSIKENTILIKNNNKKVKGTTSLKDEYTLVFITNENLLHGDVKVKVKRIELYDFENKHKSNSHKFTSNICSLFYDDIKECPVYRYTSEVKTKKIKYTFNVDDSTPKVVSLKLNKTDIDLNILNTEEINVTATYDDNSTLDITSDIQWSMSDNSIVSITDNIITPQMEGSTTLQATYNNVASTQINITVYKEINGYKLPPEPDETLNNSTLLGIDVNGNGVRDDVEIYVIKRFAQDSEFPKTKTALAMQYVWSTQKILESPVIESKMYSDDAIDCDEYWLKEKTKGMNFSDYLKYSQRNSVFNDSDINDKIYNTRERIEQSFKFNQACSGNIFKGRKESIDNCQINIDELGE